MFSSCALLCVGARVIHGLEHQRVIRAKKLLEDDKADISYIEKYDKWLEKGFFYQLTHRP